MMGVKDRKYIFDKPEAVFSLPFHTDEINTNRETPYWVYISPQINENTPATIDMGWHTCDTRANSTKFQSHSCDLILLFIGSKVDNPRDLGGEIEIRLENEKYVVSTTTLVFVPKNIIYSYEYVNCQKPIYEVRIQLHGSNYISKESSTRELYRKYIIDRPKVILDQQDSQKKPPYEIISLDLELLDGSPVFIDGPGWRGWSKLQKTIEMSKPCALAPYHANPYDVILFYIGSDKNNPENLNAMIEMQIESKKYNIESTSVVYIPKGLMHTARHIKIDKPYLGFGVQFRDS